VRLRDIDRQQCSDDSDQHDSSAIESTGMMGFKTASHCSDAVSVRALSFILATGTGYSSTPVGQTAQIFR
jgi:hypothetical protein